jgi:hypothetical protein
VARERATAGAARRLRRLRRGRSGRAGGGDGGGADDGDGRTATISRLTRHVDASSLLGFWWIGCPSSVFCVFDAYYIVDGGSLLVVVLA